MDNKKTGIILITITAVMVTSIIMSRSERKNTQNTTNNESENVQIQNIQEDENQLINEVESENTLDTQNTTTQNEVNENSANKEEVVKQPEIQGEEETKSTESLSEENKSEKALNLVKEDWGEDDTVYYTIDNESGSIFNISVRSKETTATVAEYEVDLSNSKVTMK